MHHPVHCLRSAKPLLTLATSVATLVLSTYHPHPYAADTSTATVRPLVRLTSTEGIYLGSEPNKDIFVVNGTVHATTKYGGKIEGDAKYAQYDYLYRRWGRLLRFTDPGDGDATNFLSLDASSSGIDGQDLGADMQYFALDSNDRIVGTRRYFTGGLLGMGLAAQRSGIVTWMPGQEEAPSLYQVQYQTETRLQESFSIKPRGIWTADTQGNVYGAIYMHGADASSYAYGTSIYRIGPDSGALEVIGHFNRTAFDGDAAFEKVQVAGTEYTVVPHGAGPNTVLFSQDAGGTLYALSGISSEIATWNGTYPNSSIPADDTASAVIVSISIAELDVASLIARSRTPITPLQSLARKRDGLLQGNTYSESNYTDSPSALVEVGDYLYGTTSDILWRYQKRNSDGQLLQGGAIETLHRFIGPPDGSSPQGRLVLAADGYLYGTTQTGGEHGHGSAFRIRTGLGSAAEESASYELIHSFNAAISGSGPLGLNPGSIGDDKLSQVLYGATKSGGHDVTETSIGNGVIFALDIKIAPEAVSPITIEQFTVNNAISTTVTPGADLRFDWSSSNASICSLDGQNIAPGTGNIGLAIGNSQALAPQIPGNYLYTLSCSNLSVPTAEPAQAQVSVTVESVTPEEPESPDTETPATTDDPSTELDGGGAANQFALATLCAILGIRRRHRLITTASSST